jgi:heterodisulfide reductase subunit A-like polyferredoxin
MVERFDLLVIGGGASGMQAALDSARAGLRVALVEKETELGGLAVAFERTVIRCPSPADKVLHLKDDITHEQNITLMLGYHLGSLFREGGLVTVMAADNDGNIKEFEAKAVIMATGMEPIDATTIPEFGAGRFPGVVTSLEFEAMLSKWESEGKSGVASVSIVQCVGSRVEKRGVSYCSNYCCMNAVKESIRIKRLDPNVKVHVLYIDIRTCGRGQEAAYKEARRLGVRFIRGQPAMVMEQGGRLMVCGENTLVNELYQIPSDIVVLNVGLRLSQETLHIASQLGMALDEEGLLSLDDKNDMGVPLALVGCAESPKDVDSCMEQASHRANCIVRSLGQHK